MGESWGGVILASLSFFTRVPFWRLANIPASCYERVVPLWPLVGWLTGGVMMAVLWGSMQVLPLNIAVLLSLSARVLLTGALHEDGFADFCDGFGGGTDRERTLLIMKDSHIGTYGVLGLVLYFLLMYAILCKIAFSATSLWIVIVADVFAKYASSHIINFLPYARTKAEAKNRLVYQRMTLSGVFLGFLVGVMPCVLLCMLDAAVILPALMAAVAAILTVALLFVWYHRRLQGYTGDCCGATFILSELVFYLSFIISL